VTAAASWPISFPYAHACVRGKVVAYLTGFAPVHARARGADLLRGASSTMRLERRLEPKPVACAAVVG